MTNTVFKCPANTVASTGSTDESGVCGSSSPLRAENTRAATTCCTSTGSLVVSSSLIAKSNSTPGEIHTKPDERQRLLEFGKTLGRAIEELITIVPAATFYRWCREESGGKKKTNPKGDSGSLAGFENRPSRSPRPRAMATRGSRGTQETGNQENQSADCAEHPQGGRDQARSGRTSENWENFVTRHGETLWAVDFFSVKAVTARGIRNLYLMAFLCMKMREVIVSSSTTRPNSSWFTKQTEAFIERRATRKEKPSIVMHDLDTKFTKEFVATLKKKDIRTNALPVASPNLSGRVERFIQTIKHECLFKFIVFGQKHLDHIVGEWMAYYNTIRSHTERSHLPPVHASPTRFPSWTVTRSSSVRMLAD